MKEWDDAIGKLCEDHLEACYDAMYDWEEGEGDCTSPAFAPFCGCTTCVVREVLMCAYTYLTSDESDTVGSAAGAPLAGVRSLRGSGPPHP